MGEKIEIKTNTEQRLLDDLKAAEKENETLRYCLESVSRYEKERNEFELKCAKDIVDIKGFPDNDASGLQDCDGALAL